MGRLGRSFYRRETLTVARDLLGRTLCRRLPDGEILRGRIVEVEAYDGPEDRACHAHRGRTGRNESMFLAGGALYVFQVYGVHFCANVVTGPKDYPAAVLLRATEPPAPDRSARGPGRLGRAYGIDRSDDGSSLVGGDVWLETGRPVDDREVRATARIGVNYAGAWADRLFRLVVAGSPDVSGPRRLR